MRVFNNLAYASTLGFLEQQIDGRQQAAVGVRVATLSYQDFDGIVLKPRTTQTLRFQRSTPIKTFVG